MAFIIKVNDLYEKYTSSARGFGGNIVLTNHIEEAKRITRRSDAENRIRTLNFRYRNFDFQQILLAKKYGIHSKPKIEITEI